MKSNLILSLLILSIIGFNSYSEEFDLMPTNIHFFGVVSSGHNIIAYGDNGAYLMTTDKGNIWKQYSFIKNEYAAVRDIKNYNDTLWGIFDKGSVIRSVDNGMHWTEFEFDLDSGDRFLTIEVNDDFLFIRSKLHIFKIDRYLQIVKTYTDKLIVINEAERIYIPDDYPTAYNNVCNKLVDGKLVVTTPRSPENSDSINILIISEKLEKLKEIKLREYLYSRYGFLGLSNIFQYNQKPVFEISSNLYYADDDYTKWTYFFSDTSYFNQNDSLFHRTHYHLSIKDIYTEHQNLYLDYYFRNEAKHAAGCLNINGISLHNIASKIYKENEDKFVDIDNLFENNYYTIRRVYPISWDGISSYLNNLNIFEDGIMIRTGFYKSLAQTQNEGKTWNLVSYLSGKPKAILNDSTYIYINDESNINEINVSHNYGSTFLPTQIADSASYLRGLNNIALFHVDSTGKGFLTGEKNSDNSTNNFVSTKDMWNSHQSNSFVRFYVGYGSPSFVSNIVNLDGNYLFASNRTLFEGRFYNYIYFVDSSLNSFKTLRYESQYGFDTLYAIHHIIALDSSHYNLICTVQDTNDYFHRWLEVRETSDSGRTQKTILTIDRYLEINQIYELNKDSVFFTTTVPDRLFLYDRKRNAVDTLYSENTEHNIMLMCLSGKFFLVGEKLFLENSDRSDLSKWQPSKWDYGTPSFESVIFKGNVALAKLSDSLRPLNYYRINLKSHPLVSVPEIEAEIKYYTSQFYAYPPYPNPAKSTVKTKIITDGSFDLEESIQGVYNTYGGLASTKNRVTIEKVNKYQSSMVWDCS
ncbi:MAG: hypothetical protein QG635_187, partial [Bacteroidota bacterium]|nr:hypothetical protein [Bacteroidota bacterium]